MDRHSDQALHQSEEQFRLLVTSVRDYAIFMLDPQGYIVSWNTGAQLIKGYTADEIIGRHFSIFYPTAAVATDHPAHELQLATREGVYEEEGWRIRKDGTAFWANVVITTLYADDGTLRGFGKVTQDLTERKQAEDVQRQLQERELQLVREQVTRSQAEANVRLRDAFLNATAHELRTPVTAVVGYVQLLQRRIKHDAGTTERIQKPVRAIADQVQRLDRLTTMLLDTTRLEHGTLVLERVPLDLRRVIEQVVNDLHLLTERHTMVLDLPPSPLMVEGNALRFEHVLYHLVQNAIKYSPAGGTITVTARQDGQQAVIIVTDEGLGIPPTDLPHVFERFYRATNIPQMTMSGLGLGLYVVKEVVELHGGTVEVQSVEGQGTTVRVMLPLMPSQS